MPPVAAPSGISRDIVLHIGMGKTGTSSIQSLLSRNRRSLAEAGTLYPETPGRTRHARLSLSVRPVETLDKLPAWRRLGAPDPQWFRDDFRRRLAHEIAQSGLSRVLFSDEGLFGLPDQSLADLSALVQEIGGNLRVVVYLRRQDDHLVSHYQQVVKVRETRRLIERIEQVDYSKTHDYDARLRSWSRLVKPGQLVVRRFEPDEFVEGSLHQDFFEATGTPLRADELAHAGSRNESLSAEAVEFLRIVNLLRREGHPSADALPARNEVMVSRLARISEGPVLTAPQQLLEAVMARWNASNDAVARDFLHDRAPLFRAPRRTANTTSEQYLDPDRLERFLAELQLPDETHGPLRALAEREARVR